MVRKIRVHRKAYVREGEHIPATTYLRKDTGKAGRTPASHRWFEGFDVDTEWEKEQPATERRREVLKAMGGDYLKAARHMQELVNISADKATDRKARADAEYFFAKYRR